MRPSEIVDKLAFDIMDRLDKINKNRHSLALYIVNWLLDNNIEIKESPKIKD